MNLAALAGFIDALGFLSLNGFFVSFMSGNSTRLAASTSSSDLSLALVPLSIIILFVIGVMAGSVIGHFSSNRRVPAVLGFTSAALILAGILAFYTHAIPSAMLMTIAMGAVNNVFVKEGEVSVGVTYMTGTLVKLGQRLAGVFWGGDKKAWIPHFMLWVGLMLGAVAGSLAYASMGLQAVLIAAAFSSLLFLLNLRRI